MNPNINVIIKPTNECNLACEYCYVDKNCENKQMDSRTLELSIKNVMSLPGKSNIRWIWHGGEPTLMGKSFYEEAVGLQKKYLNKQRLKNSIQTNATLIDNDFLDFFVKNNFSVSTSLDGPEEIHNLTRVYPDGTGSFKDAWAGIQLIRERAKIERSMKKHHIGGGITCVLSKKNISKLDEIYSFFLGEDIAININPIINVGNSVDKLNQLEIGDAEYGVALAKLFDKWFYEEKIGIKVKPLSSILESFISNKPRVCHFENSCRDQFISINANGDVYPCGRFDGITPYLLGNINEENLVGILNSTKHIQMKERASEMADNCNTCEYINLCNSGCMHNAYIRNRRNAKRDHYCPSYKILFSHIRNALEKELIDGEIEQ